MLDVAREDYVERSHLFFLEGEEVLSSSHVAFSPACKFPPNNYDLGTVLLQRTIIVIIIIFFKTIVFVLKKNATRSLRHVKLA